MCVCVFACDCMYVCVSLTLRLNTRFSIAQPRSTTKTIPPLSRSPARSLTLPPSQSPFIRSLYPPGGGMLLHWGGTHKASLRHTNASGASRSVPPPYSNTNTGIVVPKGNVRFRMVLSNRRKSFLAHHHTTQNLEGRYKRTNQ